MTVAYVLSSSLFGTEAENHRHESSRLTLSNGLYTCRRGIQLRTDDQVRAEKFFFTFQANVVNYKRWWVVHCMGL